MWPLVIGDRILECELALSTAKFPSKLHAWRRLPNRQALGRITAKPETDLPFALLITPHVRLAVWAESGLRLAPLPGAVSCGRMLDRVTDYIARHRMLEPGQRVGVAVSGGADSVFLLHALRELASRFDIRLSVIHIEHGIRGAASIADAEFVAGLAPSSISRFIYAKPTCQRWTAIWNRPLATSVGRSIPI